MLARNKDVEERNQHLKGFVFVLIGAAVIAVLPEMIATMVGIDPSTGCSLDGECLTNDTFKNALTENWVNVVIGFRVVALLLGLSAGGYKFAQA